ncbi:hypothetical protein TNCT_688191 [Trichonephila clavata]|uniref:Uncharacterized protein n=1 Tax=Trichonephila clavata TaxID=2740835 RepID=A0A8X6JJ24_TRICU|nr:hypothetical protein TNCT_688191 [Trichonephila clavata]
MQNNQDSGETKRRKRFKSQSFHSSNHLQNKNKRDRNDHTFQQLHAPKRKQRTKRRQFRLLTPFLITDDDCEKVPHQTATDNSIRREHPSPQLLQNIVQSITFVLCAPGLVIGHDVLLRWLGRAPRWVQRASDYLDRDAGRQVHSKCSSESLKHDRQPKEIAPIKSFVAIGRSLHGSRCSDSLSFSL